MTAKSLLVFGATGGTGAALVAQALAAGHRVTAFVRDPAKLPERPGLAAVQGDVADPAVIDRAFAAPADAVLCALGMYLKEPGTPLTEATRHILAAMKRHGVGRLVVCSSMGAGETRGIGPIWVRAVQSFILKHTLADKTGQEEAIRASGLAWTIVRPPRLTDGPAVGGYLRWEGMKPRAGKPLWQIARADVAAEMLRALDDPGTIGRAYQISM
jgi:uncharacterized protein YbjT (DUF2867 family)